MLRVGIVGCGGVSRSHLSAYARIDGVEVVAVCDVDLLRARAVAAEHGVAGVYDDVEGVLGHGVDLVSVCTPHPTHEPIVLAAARAGAHVLCEKPIATSLAAAERMTEACEAAGVRLGVFLQRRFWPAAQRMREAIASGRLGAPILGECTVLLERGSAYYAKDAWRGTWETDGGGVLMTQAIHHLDLLLWMMGEVAEVHGRVATFSHRDSIEVEDSATATIVFASGAMATVQATTAASPSLGARVRVTTSRGASVQLLEFPEGTDGRLDVWAEGGAITEERPYPPGAEPHVEMPEINRRLAPHHATQVADFVAALREGREPAVTGREATRVLRTILAIYESARTGRPVRFRPSPDGPRNPQGNAGQ